MTWLRMDSSVSRLGGPKRKWTGMWEQDEGKAMGQPMVGTETGMARVRTGDEESPGAVLDVVIHGVQGVLVGGVVVERKAALEGGEDEGPDAVGEDRVVGGHADARGGAVHVVTEGGGSDGREHGDMADSEDLDHRGLGVGEGGLT